jgi:indolepyruvate ferredoxin oxidoreductase beta subunit
MVSPGEADYLLVLEPTQVEPHRHYLKPGGALITTEAVDVGKLPNKKSLNVALLGALSAHLPLSEEIWLEALREAFPAEFFEANRQAFQEGRNGQSKTGHN